MPALTDWPDQGLELDVAVHIGTLGAVVLYFRRDVGEALRGLALLVRGRDGPGAALALKVLVATLPILLLGALLAGLGLLNHLRSAEVIGWATIGFAVLLYLADRTKRRTREVKSLGLGEALIIGALQVLALIPGTSRAGITITGARLLGLERAEAARFSMLLSIPTILAAGLYATALIMGHGTPALGFDALVAAGFAFIAALASIALLMRWVERASYTPFVLYRLLIGAALLWWVYVA